VPDVIATCDPLGLRAGLHADRMTMVIIVGRIQAGQKCCDTEA